MKVCPACGRDYADEQTVCHEDGVALVVLTTGARSAATELIGEVVDGRYRVERVIGKGGMGTVYAARHVVVGKQVALKVLRSTVDQNEAVVQRFVREAQAANAIRSRHIVEMADFGQLSDGSLFMVMELLEGMSLTQAMRSGALSHAHLRHVFVQIAEALHQAHQAGIVHRDLKPDNVFLVPDGAEPHFVKLLDFGIAKIAHTEASNLTETGVILGTPYYMSPEQARGQAVDHRTDIYALGVMMYRAFAGKLPFVADSTMGVLTAHLVDPPEPPSLTSNVDRPTEQVILRCLEKKPDARFRTMEELAHALRAIHLPLEEQTFPGPSTGEAPVGAHATAAIATGPHGVVSAPGSSSGGYPAAPGAHGSGAHPAAGSGAHAALSGPHQPVSGAYASHPGGSGAYAPASASGHHAAASGGYPAAPSGAHHPASISGSHPASISGAHPQGPHPQGPHPQGPHPQGPHPGAHGGAAGLPAMAAPHETGTGAAMVTTPHPGVAPQKSKGPLLWLGAAAMLALGAAGAVVAFGIGSGQPEADADKPARSAAEAGDDSTDEPSPKDTSPEGSDSPGGPEEDTPEQGSSPSADASAAATEGGKLGGPPPGGVAASPGAGTAAGTASPPPGGPAAGGPTASGTSGTGGDPAAGGASVAAPPPPPPPQAGHIEIRSPFENE